MPDVRVRQDIWDLGDEDDPWRDPIIGAYADAVGVMQELVQSDPSNETNWVSQAAIHERDGASVSGRLEDQCQHACWFFLPWHRMYLFWFEQIVLSHLTGPIADEWALPYWNYSDDPARRALPPAFRQEKRPDGSDNPLFTPLRRTTPIDINAGDPMPAFAVSLVDAMAPDVFTRNVVGVPPGFGGGRTRPLFHHGAQGPLGPLENTPHGVVHTVVGGDDGLMSAFGTAALDPIFWLHHANLDRLWEVWLRNTPPHSNTTESDWLTMSFELIDTTGSRTTVQVSDVLEIENQLNYTYSGLPSAPPPAPSLLGEEVGPTPDEQPAEMVGATDEPVLLAAAQSAETSFQVSAPTGPVAQMLSEEAREPRTYLNVEVEGEENPGLVYGVYVNLPPGEPAEQESPHYVGALPFFGIETTVPEEAEEEAPHRLRYIFDITPTVAELTAQRKWNPDELRVTFAPVVGPDTRPGLLAEEADPPPVHVTHVSLFVE